MCQDCVSLHEQLQKQSYEMYGLRQRIKHLRSDLKKERREKEKIIKSQQENEKLHYRNGRKRGKFGRN
jgi:hypothetical protein